jgi:S-disulfanyl-L-cysteine oxidoreductase SoxD
MRPASRHSPRGEASPREGVGRGWFLAAALGMGGLLLAGCGGEEPGAWSVPGLGAGQPSASEPLPERLELGRAATEEEIARLAIAVMPDGRGLPPGSGTAREGAPLYAAQCAACHGAQGEGGAGGRLAGRIPEDAFDFGDGMPGPRTIGSYWPWATTVFDYVRRSMPFDRPGSLSDEEVYALTAHLLYLNEIVAWDEVMDRESLPQVVMPARDRFVPDDRESRNHVW